LISTPEPTIDEATRFEGNMQAKASNSDLPVPTKPAPVPP
jgi:hypothetical protein